MRKLNQDHAESFTGNPEYEGRLTVWVYYKTGRKWCPGFLKKYTNKGNSNVGIQIEWKTGNTISEYTSKQMDLAIRFDEPTDEEKQIYPALKKKVKTLGNRKKQKRGWKAAVGAQQKHEMCLIYKSDAADE